MSLAKHSSSKRERKRTWGGEIATGGGDSGEAASWPRSAGNTQPRPCPSSAHISAQENASTGGGGRKQQAMRGKGVRMRHLQAATGGSLAWRRDVAGSAGDPSFQAYHISAQERGAEATPLLTKFPFWHGMFVITGRYPHGKARAGQEGGDKVGTQQQTRKRTRQDAEPEWNGRERQSHRRVLPGPG